MAESVLTAKQQRFADEYLIDMNASRAYKAAYPNIKNDDTARACGSRALACANIKEYIANKQAKIQEKLDIKVEDVLRKYWDLANSDPNDLVELRRACCRYCYGEEYGYQRTPQEYRDYEARYAKDIRDALKNDGEIYDFDPQGGIGYDPRKAPNLECPECFGEGVERPFFKDTRTLNPGALEAYAGVKVTRDGIEVKMASKERALEMVGKHLGMFVEKLDVKVTGSLADVLEEARKRAEEARKKVKDK